MNHRDPVTASHRRGGEPGPVAKACTAAREALAAVDPVPFYVAAGENFWARVKAHLDTVTERAAAPVIAKYR